MLVAMSGELPICVVGRRHTLLGLEMYKGASRHERRPLRLLVLHNACTK